MGFFLFIRCGLPCLLVREGQHVLDTKLRIRFKLQPILSGKNRPTARFYGQTARFCRRKTGPETRPAAEGRDSAALRREKPHAHGYEPADAKFCTRGFNFLHSGRKILHPQCKFPPPEGILSAG